MDHVQLFINGVMVYEQASSQQPPPDGGGGDGGGGEQPPVPEGVVSLGDFTTSGSPHENPCRDMAAGTTYCRRQSLDGKSGSFQFMSGYLTGYEYPNFEYWVSGTPGGEPLPFHGFERTELMGQNVASVVVDVALMAVNGIRELWFNLRSKGWTGRYMQRTP